MSHQREIQALGYLVSTIRPAWPRAIIETNLAKRVGTRTLSAVDLANLATDAIDAAATPALSSPGVLLKHRRPDRPLVDSAPTPIPKCDTCGRITCVCDIAAADRVREILAGVGR